MCNAANGGPRAGEKAALSVEEVGDEGESCLVVVVRTASGSQRRRVPGGEGGSEAAAWQARQGSNQTRCDHTFHKGPPLLVKLR